MWLELKGLWSLVLFDAADLNTVMSLSSLHLTQGGEGGGRLTYVRGIRHDGTRVRLHRLLMNPLDTEQVDHVDRDPLDNRRKNLRVVDAYGNAQNRWFMKPCRHYAAYKAMFPPKCSCTPCAIKWSERTTEMCQ